MRKHPLLMLTPALMLLFLALLYASDKKPAPVQVERAEWTQAASERARLVERLNHAPEFAGLPAQEKVRILVRELRRLRAPAPVKARKAEPRPQQLRLEMPLQPKFDLNRGERP